MSFEGQQSDPVIDRHSHGYALVDAWARYRNTYDPFANEKRWFDQSNNGVKRASSEDDYVATLDQMMDQVNSWSGHRGTLGKQLDMCESLTTQKADPDREAAERVDLAFGFVVVSSVKVIYPEKVMMARSRRALARHRAEVQGRRDEIKAALRRLAFEVHAHGCDPEALPDTLWWRYLWQTLNGQPVLWLARLHTECEDA